MARRSWSRSAKGSSGGGSTDWTTETASVLVEVLDEFTFHGPDQDVVFEWPDETLRWDPAYRHDHYVQVCLFDRTADKGVDLTSPPNPEIWHLPWLERDGGYMSATNVKPEIAAATVGLALRLAPSAEVVTLTYQGSSLGPLPAALSQLLTLLRDTRPVTPREPAADDAVASVVEILRPLPPLTLIRTARDAEENAAAVLRWLGHSDAQVTPVGTDGGIDVMAERVVAQVKMEGIPTGRPAVQALFGAATGEGKQGVFFALAGYTRQAVEWADRVALPLFTFDYQGSPAAVNDSAAQLLADGGRGPSRVP